MTRAEEIAYEVYPDYSPDGKCLVKRYVERAFFKNGYEQAKKDLIEKAVSWWSNNLVESEPTKGHYISAFKKYMENK